MSVRIPTSVFITGATGFIGAHLIRRIDGMGIAVRALRRHGSSIRGVTSENVRWMETPLGELGVEHLQGTEVLIHLAAAGVLQGNSWDECFRTNVIESLRLWLTAVRAGVRRIVVVGSCFEYGRAGMRYAEIPTDCALEPTGPYHSSKAAATMAAMGVCAEAQIELTIVRPFHTYGEGEHQSRFWPQLKAAAIAGANFEMTAGEQVRDFTPVEMLASELAHYAFEQPLRPGAPEIFNLGTGRPTTLLQFARTEWKKFGATGEILPGRLKYRENEVMRYVPRLDAAALDRISRI